ncbi:uncharacterized protein [Notamacropus eugenii]|uniref:uncharacterized protein n=1 Tax=Notamacropus eugenii TaxID=9315 RepID=UPI003B66D0BE
MTLPTGGPSGTPPHDPPQFPPTPAPSPLNSSPKHTHTNTPTRTFAPALPPGPASRPQLAGGPAPPRPSVLPPPPSHQPSSSHSKDSPRPRPRSAHLRPTAAALGEPGPGAPDTGEPYHSLTRERRGRRLVKGGHTVPQKGPPDAEASSPLLQRYQNLERQDRWRKPTSAVSSLCSPRSPPRSPCQSGSDHPFLAKIARGNRLESEGRTGFEKEKRGGMDEN